MPEWRARAKRPREFYTAVRSAYRRWSDLARRVHTDIAVNAEVRQATLRALWDIERRLTFAEQVMVGQVEEAVRDRPELADAALRNLIERRSDPLPFAVAEMMTLEYGYKSRLAEAGLWVNPPLSIIYETDGPTLLEVNERIVEIPYALSKALSLPVGSSIVDVGASESTIALSLASLDYAVTALDFRGYSLSHPNLQPVAADLFSWKPDAPADAILCVSTLEHVGLGSYGDGVRSADADREALDVFRTWLNPNGLLVLTVPFGDAQAAEHQRTYDAASLDKLLDGWKVEERRFYIRTGEHWEPYEGSRWSGVGVALISARA